MARSLTIPQMIARNNRQVRWARRMRVIEPLILFAAALFVAVMLLLILTKGANL